MELNVSPLSGTPNTTTWFYLSVYQDGSHARLCVARRQVLLCPQQCFLSCHQKKVMVFGTIEKNLNILALFLG